LSWDDETILAHLLNIPPETVSKVLSTRILVSSRKVDVTILGNTNATRPYQEAIALCEAEILSLEKKQILMYIRRANYRSAIKCIRVWHLDSITPKINMYKTVDINIVANFIKETNFGMNECDPMIHLQAIEIEDLNLVSFKKMQNNIPSADVLQARFKEYTDSYMESFEKGPKAPKRGHPLEVKSNTKISPRIPLNGIR
jgi:hypothetical protein